MEAIPGNEPENDISTELLDSEVLEPQETGEEEQKIQKQLEDEKIHSLLLTVIEKLEREEQPAREIYLRMLKRLDHMWRNRHFVIWDDEAKDFRTPQEVESIYSDLDINEPDITPKAVNVYRSYGEAVIAALGSSVPRLAFFPGDADLHIDQTAARAHQKVADLIADRNKAPLLMLQALFILWNQGPVFSYNECVEDSKFGTIRKDVYETQKVTKEHSVCPDCGSEVPPSDEMMSTQCEVCGSDVFPEIENYEDIEQVKVGEESIPKTSEVIQAFGAMNVKVPMWITNISQTPYLTLETEEHESFVKALYHTEDDPIASGESSADTTDKDTRSNVVYGGANPTSVKTVQRTWLRSWAFFDLQDEDRDLLLQRYPDGVYFVRVDEKIKEVLSDKLDDHWSVVRNPLSTHVHFDPLGQVALHIQEITNELLNLTLEAIEYGIPETFYEADAIDAEAYKNQEARPGAKFPAKARNGMGLDSQFYTLKGATVSQEMDVFARRVEQLGQFVTGAFPSIWGGAMQGGGGTKGEYEQSRAMALQRLTTHWTALKFWWAETMEKATKSFVANMRSDEKFTKKMGDSYTSILIRQEELMGQVGKVEPELGESFPISWAQQRDVLFELIKLNNDEILQIIGHTENMAMVRSLIGLPELYVPGDDDRNKQLSEIARLITQQPVGEGQPSIPVDPEIDNHVIESETCAAWLKSPVGQDAKDNLPAAYENVRLHYVQHQQVLSQQAAAQAAQAAREQEGGRDGSGEGDEPEEGA